MADQRVSSEPEETTVLFVDDDYTLLETYEVIYGSEYDVRTAEDGEEALEKFGTHIDFVFLDRRMPGMSGDEVLETIRERGYQTPVGILSAVDPETELTTEFDVYLPKPSEQSEVRTAIEQYTT